MCPRPPLDWRPRAADPRTLVIGAAFDIKSLDPARGFEQIGGMVHKATYDTLVTLDDNDVSKIVPDLAQTWELSPDAKTFTFHLQPGVKFQTSGNPLTSEDVKWSWNRAIGIKGNPSFLIEGITSIETPDPLTVKVTKSEPDPAFIAKGSFPAFAPLDSKTVQAHGGTSGPDASNTDSAEQWLNQNSAGTGPFILTRYTQDSEVDIQKFAGYWNRDAKFDRVIYRNIPQAAAEKLTLQAGDIDIATEISPDAVTDLQSNAQLKVVQGVGADIFFLLLQYPTNFSRSGVDFDIVAQKIQAGLDSGCGVQTASTPKTTSRFCRKALLPSAPTGPTPIRTRPSSSCATRSMWRRTAPGEHSCGSKPRTT